GNLFIGIPLAQAQQNFLFPRREGRPGRSPIGAAAVRSQCLKITVNQGTQTRAVRRFSAPRVSNWIQNMLRMRATQEITGAHSRMRDKNVVAGFVDAERKCRDGKVEGIAGAVG